MGYSYSRLREIGGKRCWYCILSVLLQSGKLTEMCISFKTCKKWLLNLCLQYVHVEKSILTPQIIFTELICTTCYNLRTFMYYMSCSENFVFTTSIGLRIQNDHKVLLYYSLTTQKTAENCLLSHVLLQRTLIILHDFHRISLDSKIQCLDSIVKLCCTCCVSP